VRQRGGTFAEQRSRSTTALLDYLKSQEEMVQNLLCAAQGVDHTLLITEMCSGLKLDPAVSPDAPSAFSWPECYDTHNPTATSVNARFRLLVYNGFAPELRPSWASPSTAGLNHHGCTRSGLYILG